MFASISFQPMPANPVPSAFPTASLVAKQSIGHKIGEDCWSIGNNRFRQM
jgi:hypothetical protein